jgi:methylated-DNA-protein-cysteine methyltransferase-like protein
VSKAAKSRARSKEVGGEPRVVGPGFHARVYAVVRQVPRGRVATYGQIAARLGSPRVARHVGFALAACDQADAPVPWHRIVNAQGAISARGDAAREKDQRRRLEREGVRFDARGRVDLARHRFAFPER